MKKIEQYENDTHRNQRKQARRREALNLAAKRLGFTTWTRLETAVINDDILLLRSAPAVSGKE